jgi:hypothetical protein
MPKRVKRRKSPLDDLRRVLDLLWVAEVLCSYAPTTP